METTTVASSLQFLKIMSEDVISPSCWMYEFELVWLDQAAKQWVFLLCQSFASALRKSNLAPDPTSRCFLARSEWHLQACFTSETHSALLKGAAGWGQRSVAPVTSPSSDVALEFISLEKTKQNTPKIIVSDCAAVHVIFGY